MSNLLKTKQFIFLIMFIVGTLYSQTRDYVESIHENGMPKIVTVVKESKNKIYSGSNFKLSLENGMPNIAAATNESTSATRVADNIFDMIFPIQRPNKELIFRKGYANYRLQNPTFNKKINDYFDLVILDKRGFDTQQ